MTRWSFTHAYVEDYERRYGDEYEEYELTRVCLDAFDEWRLLHDPNVMPDEIDEDP